MASYLYRGSITHTEQTILQLFRTQYRSFSRRQMLVRFLLGLGLVFLSAFTNLPVWAKGIVLIFGAWMMVSLDFPSQIQADKTLQARHGILPKMEYVFFNSEMEISGEGTMRMKYKKLIRLVQDSDYLYLFSGTDSVCMLERKSIKPSDTELMEFLSEKTGLEWKTDKSFFFLNLFDIRQILMERGKSTVSLKHKKKD